MTPEEVAPLVLSSIFAGNAPNTNADQSLQATPERVRIVAGWIRAECTKPDGTLTYENSNNPLNVAAPLDGSWRYDGQRSDFWNDLGDGLGVATFLTIQQGAKACGDVIQQANMADIEAALIAGDTAAFAAALAKDPWGTNATIAAEDVAAEPEPPAAPPAPPPAAPSSIPGIGPGLSGWIAAHQAYPLTTEFGQGQPWRCSAVEIEIGNEAGQKVWTLVGYDAANNSILPPGPGVVAAAPIVPVGHPIEKQTIGELDVQAANQQGYDSTCGWRVLIEAAMEEGLIPVDATIGKQWLDRGWQEALFRDLASEQTTGMTLAQQLQALMWLSSQLNKWILFCPLRAKPIVDASRATSAAGMETLNFSEIGGPDVAIRHRTIGVDLSVLLPGVSGDHFLLDRADDTDQPSDKTWEVLDSCHDIDGDPDRFGTDQLAAAATALFEDANGQFGWCWAWLDALPQ